MKILNLLPFSAILMTSIVFSQSNPPLYLDAEQPVEVRLDDLMSRMTLEDKVYQVYSTIPLSDVS